MSSLIHKKMTEVMKEVGSVGKNQKNTQQGFKFRGIDDMINAFYPALTKHGVFMAPRAVEFSQELKDVVRSSGKAGVDKHVAIMMEYDFYAEDGSKVTVGPIPAEGLDSGDKATNKALSAALKYALIQTFSIPTEDMAEADKDSPEIGSSTRSTTTTQQAKSAATSQPENTNAAATTSETTVTATQQKPKTTSGFRNRKANGSNGAAAKPVETAASSDGWQ